MVYLIHFDESYKHARHYVGWTHSEFTLERRLKHHENGTGSRLMKAVSKAGIPWKVVRTWDGDQCFERRLHNNKNSKRLCPICSPDTWAHKYHTQEEST